MTSSPTSPVKEAAVQIWPGTGTYDMVLVPTLICSKQHAAAEGPGVGVAPFHPVSNFAAKVAQTKTRIWTMAERVKPNGSSEQVNLTHTLV
jgi:hypothetical protein